MADQQLIAALAALTGQMNLNQQQLHDDLIAQQQAHYDLINQLAVQPVPAAQSGPRSSAVSSIPTYSGQATDCLSDWLSILNRTAIAEGWTDDVKRRVAIGKLSGPALQWQDLTGHGHQNWQAWLTALEATFRPRLSLVEWCIRVERRAQLPNESGAQYALEKIKLCRLCPHPLPDAEIVNYLSKGLYFPDQRAIMLSNPPADLDAFISRIRDLEAIGGSVSQQTPTANHGYSLPPVAAFAVPPLAGSGDPFDLAAVLKGFSEQMNQTIREMRGIVQSAWRPPPLGSAQPTGPIITSGPTHGTAAAAVQRPNFDGAYAARPRRPVTDITCFNCNMKGHYARDCPQTPRTGAGNIVATYATMGNEMAGQWGQDRPNQ